MNFEKLTAYLDSLSERYGVPSVDLKIVKNHEEIYRHMTGFSDYKKTVPITANDLYNIYSCSKPVTMVAVMQLVEQGKIDLFDPLEKYLPEYSEMYYATDIDFGGPNFHWPDSASNLVKAENKIYIHDLMSMSAGFSYDVEADAIVDIVEQSNGTANTREIVAAMAKMPLMFEPGTHYAYSLSHDVLAAVVEVASGMTFAQYVQKHIFDPLEIQDIFYHIPPEQNHRLVAQYAKNMDTGEIKPDQSMPYRFTPHYDSGGAGLTCTVDAFCKIIDALANGGVGQNGKQILKPESIDTMRKDWLNDIQKKDFAQSRKYGYSYGLGVRTLVDTTKAKTPVGEFGWDGAAGAFSLVDPTNHICMYYAQEVLTMLEAYYEIFPAIRDLAYEAMGY